MWIAFVFSLLFTFIVGYAAAKNRVARALILPALDVLQSVPVLGFLSARVAGFMALFPGGLLGVEHFRDLHGTGMEHDLRLLRRTDFHSGRLQEAASTYGLNRWQRFTTLEVPASMLSLIWNSMMSFGGGWFFVAQSEAISVMNKDIKLPGLGSFMASAVERGDNFAGICAILAMLAVILAIDQLVWRPLVAWADKFKIEPCGSGTPPSS
jgi:NitT/TauT family transport system permease protein